MQPELHPCARLALATHHLADMRELRGHALVGRDDFVECVGNLALQPGPVARQAHREIADPHGLQGMQQLVHAEGMPVQLAVASFEDGARDLQFGVIDSRDADVAMVIQVHD